MIPRGGFMKGIEAQLDLSTFETILATIDRFIARRVVPDVGALVTWQVEATEYRPQPLGYVMALPVGDRIIIGFYRMEGDMPLEVKRFTNDTGEVWGSTGTSTIPWLVAREITDALRRRGIRWWDATWVSTDASASTVGV